MCEVSELTVIIDINGQPAESEFFSGKPIEVESNTLVIITAIIEPGPEGCEGSLSVDWLLLFDSNPPRVEISELPTSEILEITTGSQSSDGLIALTVKDASGVPKERVFLPLKVIGE